MVVHEPSEPVSPTARDDAPTRAHKTVINAEAALDALAALSVKLSCQSNGPPHALVLSAGNVKEACTVIDHAVIAVRQILVDAVHQRGGMDRPPT